MVAPHREVEALREGIGAGLDLTDPPPTDLDRIAILFRASHLAAPAVDAARHVEMETVLFARGRHREGH
jgi:hypothetical protein